MSFLLCCLPFIPSSDFENLGALNISSEFLSVGISGMESSELLLGRPFRGCAILYRKEICLNNIIRKIWCLSQRCHTSLLQLISGLPRSQNLASSAIQSSSRLISDVFLDSSNLIYTSTGYNLTFGHKHWKVYTDSDNLTAKFLFDVKMNSSLNSTIRRY